MVVYFEFDFKFRIQERAEQPQAVMGAYAPPSYPTAHLPSVKS